MFDSWLKSQNISESEYSSLSADQQQALKSEFETEMKEKMNEKLGIGTTAAESSSSSVSIA